MGLVHWFRWLVYVQSFLLVEHSASINKKYQLNATITPSNATNQNIVWTSSNTSIAIVDNNWLVTPTWEGNVTITATLDGHTDSCELEVELIPVTWVSLNKNSTTIQVWETEQLVATVTPNDASDKSVTWTSSNTSVATVDSTWLVTYVWDGSCTITVTTVDWSYTATCSVTCVSKRKVCFLLVWGWGWGSQYYWWWGWAWWVIQCTNYEMNAWSYSVVIGAWWCWIGSYCDWNDWWNSTFNWLTAYGWWGWWWYSNRPWHNWWSWGWWWYLYATWWTWCSWQWHNWWWCTQNWSWWGWGAWSAWCQWASNYYWGYWWNWILSCIDWTAKYYSPWWSWHSWYNYSQSWNSTWWAASWAQASSNATCYWWWGWWVPYSASYWQWKAGIFILAYPSSCWYSITWGTKYLCNWNCIHCFTWNGTLTIS